MGWNVSVMFECKPIVNDVNYFIENCCMDISIDDKGMFVEEKPIEYLSGIIRNVRNYILEYISQRKED